MAWRHPILQLTRACDWNHIIPKTVQPDDLPAKAHRSGEGSFAPRAVVVDASASTTPIQRNHLS
jgi:hypothetical protein